MACVSQAIFFDINKVIKIQDRIHQWLWVLQLFSKSMHWQYSFF